MKLLGVLLLLLASLASFELAAGMDWQWRTGRATNYGGSGDPWSIHHGSCGYKYLDPTTNKGWDVAALADAVSDYKGSCGRCYEIGCAPMHLKDGYGTGLDRSHVCYDTDKTVTVMITDTCPCYYPPNEYSNKRWCCGDYYHFDMSTWAFEKLADRKWGVIGVRYREVPCNYCPQNPAVLPNGASPQGGSEGPPGGWQPSWDKRPAAQMCFKSSLEKQDSNGGGGGSGGDGGSNSGGSWSNSGGGNGGGGSNSGRSGGGGGGSNSGGGGGNSGGNRAGGGSNSGGGNSVSSTTSAGSSSGGGSSSRQFPSNSLLSGWQDLTAKLNPWSATAPNGHSAYCGTLDGHASVMFKGSTGSMMGKTKLIITVKTENGQVPDFSVNLSSDTKGTCRSVDLRSVEGAQRNGDWADVTIPLINLAWWKSGWSFDGSSFNGCSNSIGGWDVNQIEFKNKWGARQAICLSDVKAY